MNGLAQPPPLLAGAQENGPLDESGRSEEHQNGRTSKCEIFHDPVMTSIAALIWRDEAIDARKAAVA